MKCPGKAHSHQEHQEHAKTVEFFDRLAETWDSVEQDQADILSRLEEHSELLALRPGDNLLEVGCGTGQLTAWLAARVSPGKVTAVDFSPKMLTIAKTKCDHADFRLIDVCRDSFAPNSFDVILCFHCLPHFHDIPAALNNLARSLKTGGRLLVIHLHSRKEINDFHDKVGGPVAGHHLPDDDRWESLLAAAALQKTTLLDGNGLYLLEAVKCPTKA